MADLSDDSDVNPDEMARMVEEFDDLDNTLLGVGGKTNSFPAAKRNTVTKKKISFKDTIDDDPLADLSSDEDLYTAKKPILANAKSNLLADLFGVKKSEAEEKVAEPIKKDNETYTSKIDTFKEKSVAEDNTFPIPMNNKSSNAIESTGRSTQQNNKLPPNETAEIVPKMEDPPKSAIGRDRKSSLMEDMFGTRGRSAQSREIDSRSSFSNLGLENPANSVLTEPPKFDKTIKTTRYTLEPSTTREPRRGRRNSPIISDPLGLFATPAKQTESTLDIVTKTEDSRAANSLPQDDLPEWLGGSSKSKENKTENVKQTVGQTNGDSQDLIDSRARVSDPSGTKGLSTQQSREIYHPEISMLIGSQFDQQAALISMQQQEHELRTAANLSHQNQQITRIVDSQKSKLDEQGKMFNSLIKRQFDRQSMLESQMRMQQARIDNYIQTLMAQPTSLPTVMTLETKTIDEDGNNDAKEITPESMVKRLQLENDYLENTLEKLKEKHDKELEILGESYEKQILFLRQAMEKLEKKIQQDSETLEIEYEKKIEKLKIEMEQLEQNHREDIEELKKNEKLLIDNIHIRHSHNIELLEKEHAETIDGITRAKELERSAVESITSHKNDLGNLVQQSKEVIESFQNLQKRLEVKDEQFGNARESNLRKQEENLQHLRDQLNLQQESVSEERKRLVETCQKLDTASVNLTAEFAKKSSLINDTEERLATRERALIREKELFDEQIKWEREHLQKIQESWMKEQERQIKLLSEERESIVTERTKLQVLNRLQNNSDDMAKVELEAALRTAQEAENTANMERRKWQERSNALETQKRDLCEKERYLVQRAKELESLTQSALAKRDEGLRALNEAKRIEKQHKERLGQFQSQLESLAERENKVATEKLSLARERLAAKFVPPEKPEKDTEEIIEPGYYRNDRSDLVSNSIYSTHFKDVVDPHLLLLKLDLDNKLDTSNEILAAMNINNQ